MEEFEREVLIKLKRLTEQCELSWYFAGEANKMCVAFYREARLKLFPTRLEINDREGDTAVVDVLVSDTLEPDFQALLRAARRSAGRYPTGEIKVVNKNRIDIFKKLLQD
jgi:hypothetical protein